MSFNIFNKLEHKDVQTSFQKSIGYFYEMGSDIKNLSSNVVKTATSSVKLLATFTKASAVYTSIDVVDNVPSKELKKIVEAGKYIAEAGKYGVIVYNLITSAEDILDLGSGVFGACYNLGKFTYDLSAASFYMGKSAYENLPVVFAKDYEVFDVFHESEGQFLDNQMLGNDGMKLFHDMVQE